MKRGLNFVFVALLASSATRAIAQPDSLWSRSYGGPQADYSISLCPAHDEGFVLQCSATISDDEQVWIIKTNAFGDSLWGRVYGGPQADFPGNIGKTAEGGYFFTGYTASEGAGGLDFWLVKMDSDGEQEWSRTYGGFGDEHCYWGQQTGDGGFILAGETMSFGNANFDVWVLKVDANGDSVWSQQFGGNTADAGGTYVSLTSDGGFVVCGVTRPAGSPQGQYWLIKLAASGTPEWSNTFGDQWDDIPWCVQQCADGGFVSIGTSTRGSGLTDAWLLRTNLAGDSLWSSYIGAPGGNEQAWSAVELGDGGFVIAGMDGVTGGNVMLVRTDESGNTQWTGSYGGGATDAAYQVLPTSDGGYVIGGGTMSVGAGNVDVWLLKTGPDPLDAIDHRWPIVAGFELFAYPNPFNASTTIRYDLASQADILLQLVDVQGRLVATLDQGLQTAGGHSVMLDASGMASGSYFANLQAGGASQSTRLVVLK
ncbi:MAG: T9SS type A sorting domain-containing protein [bacterium]|nr:T9SS type A sorting domain-containing protein [bacterium]